MSYRTIHLIKGNGPLPWCGTRVPASHLTQDYEAVTCSNCRRVHRVHSVPDPARTELLDLARARTLELS